MEYLVGFSGTGYGDFGAVSDDSFTFEFTSYRVTILALMGGDLYFGVEPAIVQRPFLLEAGGVRFDFADADVAATGLQRLFRWRQAGLNWSDGDVVRVQLAYDDSTDDGATAVPAVALSDGRASEGDGAVVFVATVTPPHSAGTDAAVSEVSFRYMTEAATASAGSDYTSASGTLTVPAGERRATIVVPIVDDESVEAPETFTLHLGSPSGAMLAATTATATIIDDDGPAAVPAAPVSVCEGAALRGAVGDVFDVEQPGYDRWHHVFVDVGVSCADILASPLGVPTAVRVMEGPSGLEFLNEIHSSHCLTGTGASAVTVAVSVAGGCPTAVPEASSKLTRDGVTSHVLAVPDSDIGKDRRLFAWIDLNTDGGWNAGEPFDTFTSDFASRALDDSGLYAYEYPSDFDLEVLDGSARIGNAGFVAELRLQLWDLYQGVRLQPLPDTPVGASVYAGPSTGAAIFCYHRPAAAARLIPSPGCETDDNGQVVLRYAVSTELDNLLRQERDSIRVYVDRDRDGRHDYTPNHPAPEPQQQMHLPIAKALNYVALGDSYSAGENGRRDTTRNTFDGDYLKTSVADVLCRRWDKAYPVVYANSHRAVFDTLDIGLTFDTFACTGAVTANIYEPDDPLGTSTHEDHVFTNRPSKPAPELDVVKDAQGNRQLDPSSIWEHRQSVSLANTQDELERQKNHIDMVTITIGGNDAGFGEGLRSCVSPELFGLGPDDICNEDSAPDFTVIADRVTSVLQQLRIASPRASIFILGYPYVTPLIGECSDTPRRLIDGSMLGELSAKCLAAVEAFQDTIDACSHLSALMIAKSSDLKAKIGALIAPSAFRIDAGEATFLRTAADHLNEAIEKAASRAGVHFVDILGRVISSDGPLGFEGHTPCDAEPWLNGFVLEPLNPIAVSGRSFHPTVAGHRDGYAEILAQYISNAVAGGAVLNSAGLPVNPPVAGTGHGARQVGGGAGSSNAFNRGVVDHSPPSGGGGAQQRSEETAPQMQSSSAGFLFAERVAAVAGSCDAGFVSPGDQVKLSAGGFAPGASVSFSARGASLGSAELGSLSVPDAAADANGFIEALWSVPDAPAPEVDAAPRGYVVDASGAGAGGGTHTAHMVEPLVAYPGAAPCAAADAVTTTLGQAVRIPVLANDAAPAGASLDATSLRVGASAGGSFAVDAGTGSVTFTPDTGFAGTARATYVVYDSWGVGVRAAIDVTVDAGCTITGTAGVVEIIGTDGDDVICVPEPSNRRAFHVIDAKAGDDIVLGGAGVDWIYGGEGTDTIYGRGESDRIDAGAGTDTIYGGTGRDIVYSSDLADAVHDDGAEVVVVPAGSMQQQGPTAGADWVHVDVSVTATIDVSGNDYDPNDDLDPFTLRITAAPASGAARVINTTDTGPAIQYVAPNAGGPDSLTYEICDRLGACDSAEATITVGAAGCTIVGTAASETLHGTPGDDVICGAGGDDTIFGHGGNDTIIAGAGRDSLHGGEGNDILWGGAGNDTLWGGPDDDILWGGAGDDTLWGNRGNDTLHGGTGDDTAQGGLGEDTLFGGTGADRVYGGEGNDRVHGGTGDDLMRGGEQHDTLFGGAGDDTLIGGPGDDTLIGGPGDDNIQGDEGDDTIWGGPGDDTLRGNGHNDQLHGGTGDDTARGGDGTDRVYGGSGDDILYGGNGTDYLNAGPDTDTCTSGETNTQCENHSDKR